MQIRGDNEIGFPRTLMTGQNCIQFILKVKDAHIMFSRGEPKVEERGMRGNKVVSGK